MTALQSYCEPGVIYAYPRSIRPLPDIEAVVRTDQGLTSKYTFHDLLIANAVGIFPLLQEMMNIGEQNSFALRLKRSEIKQQILTQLLLASTEVNSMAAELDCEGERAEQLAYYLDEEDRQRVKKYTLLSIVIGALTTVVTAVGSEGVQEVGGIVGGLTSAGFGVAAAGDFSGTLPLQHKRNLLSDIWRQNTQSSAYSPFVWYVLNDRHFSNSKQFSISHNLRQRWLGYTLNTGGAQTAQEALLFGEGGTYNASELHIRSQMLGQLQASVYTINQDLQSFILNFATRK